MLHIGRSFQPTQDRSHRALPLLICLALWMIILFSANGLAEGYPESEHPYAENSDITWTYAHTEAAYALKITFSDDTELEANYDFLYIIAEDGTEQKFTGTSLRSKSVYVLGDRFTLRLTSDYSANRNGFKITAVEAVTQAEYENDLEKSYYRIDSSGVIIAYSGHSAELVVPSEIDGVTVSGIGYAAFRNNTDLTSVILPESVKSIDSSAFRGCSRLESIHIPDGVDSIEEWAFAECSSLASIRIPDGVTSIGYCMFYRCTSLTSVHIPESVMSIGDYGFTDCSSLMDMNIPDSVTSIGNYAFSGCSSLTGVYIPDGVGRIGDYAFYRCSSLEDIRIPDGVTSIDAYAFYGCSSLTAVRLPDSVTGIGDHAFRGCSGLTNIELPDGIEVLGYCAFYQCGGLVTAKLPAELTSIGGFAFSGCSSLKNIVLPEPVTAIGECAFQGCSSLESIVFPDGISDIGRLAFNGCQNVTAYCEAGTVSAYSITDAGIKFVDSEKADFVLGQYADANGAYYLLIADYTGSGETVTIPAAIGGVPVRRIGNAAFGDCSHLTSIHLPDSIDFLGEFCFPSGTVLVFGTNEVVETYAILNGYPYISDSHSVVADGITDVEEKIDWVVASYTDPSMSDYEIALNLYHWVCNNVEYDYGWLDTEIAVSPLGVCGEAALIDGWAVCQGYAEAYCWLMREAGMEANVVVGYEHAWTLVELDGEWYHFDATWDDTGGGSAHTYFALSDMAIHAEPVNHGTQENYRHIVCDAWAANYFYRNGCLDAALDSLRSSINESIAAGVYSGALTVDSDDYPDGQYSEYTIALILNNESAWDVDGRVEITPSSNTEYSFVFYPDEELVTDIIVEGMNEVISGAYYYMYPGYTAQMKVSTLPQGKNVSYASSNESVLTVSETGWVTAIAEGEANIILTSDNCSRAFSIYVTDGSGMMDADSIHLDVGENAQAELNTRYSWFLTDTAAVWSSADETIATVGQTGQITAVGYGITNITLTSAVGATDTVEVYVRRPLTAAYFSPAVLEERIGEYIYTSLYAISEDPEAYDELYGKEFFGGFSLESSNESIVSIYGRYSATWDEGEKCWVYHPCLIGNAPGIATITAAAGDGSGLVATCQVIVRSDSPFRLPAAIKTIEREAFLAIAAGEVVLPEGVESIGSRAFAGSTHLRLINLPASLQNIAADAFEGSENVTLICAANSEGQRFAEERGIPYVIR